MKSSRPLRKCAALAAAAHLTVLAPLALHAADEPEAKSGQSLGQAAEDPTASLMSLQVADWYTADFHGLSGEDANSIVLRPVLPFTTGNLHHIFRFTMKFLFPQS